jgi:serine/threonine-protein kinase PknG
MHAASPQRLASLAAFPVANNPKFRNNSDVPAKFQYCYECSYPVANRNLDKGYCPKCGTPFDYSQYLSADDLVAGKYRVRSALTYQRPSWLYLASDVTGADGDMRVIKPLVEDLCEEPFLLGFNHQNVMRVFEFVEHQGRRYAVLEFVDGACLQRRVMPTGSVRNLHSLSVHEAALYLDDVLAAQQYIHDQGYVHHNLKPEHVIISNGRAKLIDLGDVCRKSDTDRDRVGSEPFIAPELFNPNLREFAPTANVFAAGMLFGWMCTPLPRITIPRMEGGKLARQQFGWPAEVHDFFCRATALRAGERFADSQEMAAALRSIGLGRLH